MIRRTTETLDAPPPGPAAGAVRLPRALTMALCVWLLGLVAPPATANGPHPARPATSRPLLWSVETDSATCYVFGTIHLADPRVVTLSPAVLSALEACDALHTEIPLDTTALAEASDAMMLPDGRTLQDILPAALVERLESFLAERQQSLDAFAHMKPWVLASLLTMMDTPNLFDLPLDQRLHERARRAGKKLGGLETVAEQLAVLDSLSPATSAALLEDTLDLLESDSDALEDLVQAYLSGDENVILDLMTSYESGTQPDVQRYLERLIDDRNVLLSQRILDLLRRHPQRSFFFAVGAGHLPGDDGILARLRRHGLRVTRVED